MPAAKPGLGAARCGRNSGSRWRRASRRTSSIATAPLTRPEDSWPRMPSMPMTRSVARKFAVSDSGPLMMPGSSIVASTGVGRPSMIWRNEFAFAVSCSSWPLALPSSLRSTGPSAGAEAVSWIASRRPSRFSRRSRMISVPSTTLRRSIAMLRALSSRVSCRPATRDAASPGGQAHHRPGHLDLMDAHVAGEQAEQRDADAQLLGGEQVVARLVRVGQANIAGGHVQVGPQRDLRGPIDAQLVAGLGRLLLDIAHQRLTGDAEDQHQHGHQHEPDEGKTSDLDQFHALSSWKKASGAPSVPVPPPAPAPVPPVRPFARPPEAIPLGPGCEGG